MKRLTLLCIPISATVAFQVPFPLSHHKTQTLSTTTFSSSVTSRHPQIDRTTYGNSNDNINIHGNTNILLRRMTTTESSSSSENDTSDHQKKLEERKKRVVKTNQLLTMSFVSSAALLLIQKSPSTSPSEIVSPLLAAGLAYILSDAASNDRLKSDTYKRLNLFLAEYGLLAFVSGILLKSKSTFGRVTCVMAVVNSIKGYWYGLKGWDKAGDADPVTDISDGVKSSCTVLTSVPNMSSVGYLLATLTVASLKMVTFLGIVKMVMANAGTALLGAKVVRLSNFVLLAVISFTLKDAADRDRLQGTTFIELNVMNSLGLAIMMGCLWSESMVLGTAMGAFSMFSAFNGALSVVKKREKKKKGERKVFKEAETGGSGI